MDKRIVSAFTVPGHPYKCYCGQCAALRRKISEDGKVLPYRYSSDAPLSFPEDHSDGSCLCCWDNGFDWPQSK